MNPPSHLPPLPEGTEYGGRLADYEGRMVCHILDEGDNEWTFSRNWEGMKGFVGDPASWHVAITKSAEKDKPTPAPAATLHEIIAQMELRGGNFVQKLAAAMRAADTENLERIKAAFPEIIERYDALAACGKEAA